ncbi:MAG: 1-deoxy-D-xylulose-5-phosphate reductoisomerase [Clostridia bacterium]|nr:1-deoxy-D-xylulose-5-phosphate reductoisomerase [Clostridia bacterium]
MIKIALLGSTGSIGRQVLNVVDRYPNKFKIVSMSAGSNAVLFNEQINKYKPQIASLYDVQNLKDIKEVPNGTSLYYGENAIIHAVDVDCDVVFVAVMGFCGVKAVKYALENGKRVALANKETLISAGELIMPLAKKNNVSIIPVDSEHSAIWQCLDYNNQKPFKNLIITASGGAFRNKTKEELELVTSQDALRHPTWKMGNKITIDCATMMNKGFEVLEAMHLFNTSLDRIKVLIHPESIVHSMVEFEDGGIIAQLGDANMELPIQLALTYPNRLPLGDNDFSLVGKNLSFFEVDREKYPCFALFEQVIKKGGVYPCATASADEEAVKLFLQGRIKFTEIVDYIGYALEHTQPLPMTFENLYYIDFNARRLVNELYIKRNKK